MKSFLTLDDIDVRGKTVILRVDINSPVDEKGNVQDNERIRESSITIRELLDKRAKVVILAHQGRKGDPDFTSLRQHSLLLSKHVGKEIEFVDDIVGEKAKERIRNLREGEAILLENVRFLDEETEKKSPLEHSKSRIVENLAPLADFFVNDAFSASHRAHASIVGFPPVLPSAIGRTFEREFYTLQSLILDFKFSKYDTFILGGAKPEDPIKIMTRMLKEGIIENVLTCGVIGEIFLIASGCDLGNVTTKFLEERGYLQFLSEAKKLLNEYGERIKIPLDLAFELEGKRVEIEISELPINFKLLDIGSRTCEFYGEIIKNSTVVVMKGPAGVYEVEKFGKGTRMILESIINSKCISFVGGGNTLDALEKLGIEKDKFSYISLGGGALVTFLAGEEMPGIEALKVRKA